MQFKAIYALLFLVGIFQLASSAPIASPYAENSVVLNDAKPTFLDKTEDAFHKAGSSIASGAKKTGAAISNGAKAAGRGIVNGAKATGRGLKIAGSKMGGAAKKVGKWGLVGAGAYVVGDAVYNAGKHSEKQKQINASISSKEIAASATSAYAASKATSYTYA